MRRGEDDIDEADRITAGDMMRSIDLHEALLARAPGMPRTSRRPPRSPHAGGDSRRHGSQTQPPKT